MTFKLRLSRGEWMTAIAVIVFFIAASYFSQVYQEDLRVFVEGAGPLGAVSYFLISVMAVVFAPFSSIPLVPVSVAAWGRPLAAALTIGGWWIGSIVAFHLARRWGRPLVSRFASLKRVDEVGAAFTRRHLFWKIAFLQMVMPVEVLNYALGLFVEVRPLVHATATLIGVIPFALIFVYAAGLSVGYQIAAAVLALIILLIVFTRFRRMAK